MMNHQAAGIQTPHLHTWALLLGIMVSVLLLRRYVRASAPNHALPEHDNFEEMLGI